MGDLSVNQPANKDDGSVSAFLSQPSHVHNYSSREFSLRTHSDLFDHPEQLKNFLEQHLGSVDLSNLADASMIYQHLNPIKEDGQTLHVFVKITDLSGNSTVKKIIAIGGSLSLDKTSQIAPHEMGVSFLSQYPKEELYRLVVDGRLIEKEDGWLGYEKREPNSLAGVFNGLALSLEHIQDDHLTSDFICDLHGAITQGVTGEINKLEPGKFRKSFAFFHIPLDPSEGRATKEGFIMLHSEIEEKKAQELEKMFNDEKGADNSYYYIMKNIKPLDSGELYDRIMSEEGNHRFRYDAPYASTIETRMPEIINNYNNKILNADTKDEKILVIAEAIRGFELLHPFADANGRVFVNVLLNHMLMQNGMPPATFYEPNIFDAHTPEQLVGKIKEAQENTLKIIAGEVKTDASKLSQEDAAKYDTAVERLENQRRSN